MNLYHLKPVFHLFVICWLLFCLPYFLFAQTDSLSFHTQTVEITDSILHHFRNSRSDVSIFAKDSLQSFGISGISIDAVLRQAEGLYIRNYGGHGGVKTMSFRGFATQQSTFTINNIPYTSPQSGTVNIANFLLDTYDEIAVFRAPANAVVNPLGGNVNVSLQNKKAKRAISGALGLYGEKIIGANWGWKWQKMHLQLAYKNIQAKDNFPYEINGEKGLRDNAGFRSQQYQGQYDYDISPSLHFSYFLTGFRNIQGIPDPIVTGNTKANGDSLQQQDVFQYAQLTISPPQIHHIWQPSRITITANQHYNKMQALTGGKTDIYKNQYALGQVQISHIFAKHLLHTVFQVENSYLEGNNLAIRFRPVYSVERWQGNVGVEHQFLAKKWQTHSLLRLNMLSQYGVLGNMSLGGTFVQKNMTFFAHLIHGKRVPAFNELYYFGYGNADLKPEKIYSADIGVLIQKKIFVPISFKINFFANRTQNKIISIPLSPVRWSTQSIGIAQTWGAEYSLEAKLTEKQHLYINYTLQKSVDLTRNPHPILPYTPIELLNYGYRAYIGKWQFYLNGNYSGWRFSALQNQKSTFLPAYHLLDIGTEYHFSFQKYHLHLTLQVENIGNKHYEVIRSYPMPPVMGRLKLTLLM